MAPHPWEPPLTPIQSRGRCSLRRVLEAIDEYELDARIEAKMQGVLRVLRDETDVVAACKRTPLRKADT